MSLMAQKKVNDYKYVIVANQFDFVKGADRFQLNSLTKFLFNKQGFTALLADEDFPEELFNNRCLALYADVKKVKGGFLVTKLQIELRDCKEELIFSSKIGISKEKEYAKVYNLAIRDAATSLESLSYKYQPVEGQYNSSTSKTNDTELDKTTEIANEEIERLQNEIKVLKEEKVVKTTIVVTPVVVPKVTKKAENNVVEKVEKTEASETKKETIQTLYAQPIDNGYQLVDSTPKVIMILIETGKTNTFIVKGENSIVYKEDGFWYVSKNDGNKVTTEKLNIKF
jgi:hypothetical protein